MLTEFLELRRTLKYALHFKTRLKVTGGTGDPCPRCSGKFQALQSWRSTWCEHRGLAPRPGQPDCPSKTPASKGQTEGAAPGPRSPRRAGVSRATVAEGKGARSPPSPGTPPASPSGGPHARTPTWGRWAAGGQLPAPARPHRRCRQHRGGRRQAACGQMRAEPRPPLPELPRELLSRPPPLVGTPREPVASGSGNAVPGLGLGPPGHLPASLGDLRK